MKVSEVRNVRKEWDVYAERDHERRLKPLMKCRRLADPLRSLGDRSLAVSPA